MTKYVVWVLIVVAAAVGWFVLQRPAENEHENAGTMPPPPSQQQGSTPGMVVSGNVVETMDAGGYTYVLVDTGNKKIWAAGPITKVEVGSPVEFYPEMQMTDFKSEALDRTFDAIYFVPQLITAGTPDEP